MADARIRIRSAGPADAADVVGVYVDSSNAGFGQRQPTRHADAARIERWRLDLAAKPPHHWWVALRRGVIVGVVGWSVIVIVRMAVGMLPTAKF